jgi:hypothetical protein
VGIPFGITSLVVGINLFRNTPGSTSELEKIQGGIQSFGIKNIYDKEAETNFQVFYIKLDTHNEFYTAIGKQKALLKTNLPKRLKRNQVVTVWYKKQSKYIEQLSVGDKLLIEYSPPYWIAHFFTWLGVITLASGGIYLIKHPEDLTGKKKV